MTSSMPLNSVRTRLLRPWAFKVPALAPVLALCLALAMALGMALCLGACSPRDREAEALVRERPYHAVPLDALALQHFRSFEVLHRGMVDTAAYLRIWAHSGSGLDSLLALLPRWLEQEGNPLRGTAEAPLRAPECICSLHDAGKNTFAVLLSMDWNDGPAQEAAASLAAFFQARGFADRRSDYHGQTLHSLQVGRDACYWALASGYLLLSSKQVVVESAIRHLETRGSLMDTPLFAQLVRQDSKLQDSRLFVRGNKVPKMFTVFLGKGQQSMASFCSRLSDWVVLGGDMASGRLSLQGRLVTQGGEARYLDFFKHQSPQAVEAWQALPANTLALASLSFSDLPRFLEDYGRFLSLHKQASARQARLDTLARHLGTEVAEWFGGLYPAEVALAAVPAADTLQYLTVIRSRFVSQAKLRFSLLSGTVAEEEIKPNPLGDFLSPLLGKLFALNTATHYGFYKNYLFLGEEAVLGKVFDELKAGAFYSLQDNLRQGLPAGALDRQANFTCLVQPALDPARLQALLDKRWQGGLDSLSRFNTQYIGFQVVAGPEGLGARAVVEAKNLDIPPHIRPLKLTKQAYEISPDTLAVRGLPPFTLHNHATRKENILEQKPAPDYRIRQIDERNRLLWTFKADRPIVDSVVQIDFLKNHKLQVLFALGGSLHLLDRTGREVKPYPATYDQEIQYGPYVFDLRGDKEYQIFLYHRDSVLRKYAKDGTQDPRWRPYPLEGYACGPLRYEVIDGTAYWLVFSSSKTAFLDANSGELKAALPNPWLLDPAAPLTFLGKGVVEGLTIENKPVRLNLLNGQRVKIK